MRPGETTEVRLVVRPELRITGRVVEHGGGAPLPGATVHATIGGRLIRARTDAGGRFELAGALAGERIALLVSGDPQRHVRETGLAQIPAEATGVHDLGAFRLMRVGPGESPRRWRRGSGLSTARDGDRLIVTAVEPGSPAARAGIAPGDWLRAIDGRTPGELGPAAVDYLVGRTALGPVTLWVQSPGGGGRTVALTEP